MEKCATLIMRNGKRHKREGMEQTNKQGNIRMFQGKRSLQVLEKTESRQHQTSGDDRKK